MENGLQMPTIRDLPIKHPRQITLEKSLPITHAELPIRHGEFH